MRCRETGSTFRSRSRRISAPTSATRNWSRTARSCRGSSGWSAIRQFLADEGLADAQRSHLQGDASTRAYERIAHEGRKLVLMNAPRRPDGPPVRGGLPYSAIAHLAEDVKPFVAMARALRDRGLSAPQVHAANLNEGLLLLEDLGSEAVVAGDPPGRSRSATRRRSMCWSKSTASRSPSRCR